MSILGGNKSLNVLVTEKSLTKTRTFSQTKLLKEGFGHTLSNALVLDVSGLGNFVTLRPMKRTVLIKLLNVQAIIAIPNLPGDQLTNI